MPQVATFPRVRNLPLPFLIVDARGNPIASFHCESDAAWFRNRQRVDRGRLTRLITSPHTYDPDDKSTDRRTRGERRAFSQRRSGLDRRRPEAHR